MIFGGLLLLAFGPAKCLELLFERLPILAIDFLFGAYFRIESFAQGIYLTRKGEPEQGPLRRVFIGLTREACDEID